MNKKIVIKLIIIIIAVILLNMYIMFATTNSYILNQKYVKYKESSIMGWNSDVVIAENEQDIIDKDIYLREHFPNYQGYIRTKGYLDANIVYDNKDSKSYAYSMSELLYDQYEESTFLIEGESIFDNEEETYMPIFVGGNKYDNIEIGEIIDIDLYDMDLSTKLLNTKAKVIGRINTPTLFPEISSSNYSKITSSINRIIVFPEEYGMVETNSYIVVYEYNEEYGSDYALELNTFIRDNYNIGENLLQDNIYEALSYYSFGLKSNKNLSIVLKITVYIRIVLLFLSLAFLFKDNKKLLVGLSVIISILAVAINISYSYLSMNFYRFSFSDIFLIALPQLATQFVILMTVNIVNNLYNKKLKTREDYLYEQI